MNRCPFAIWLPGPPEKTSGTLEAWGATLHSAEYDLPDDEQVLHNALMEPGREASWTFTITRENRYIPAMVFQHYDTNMRTWHCGPGNPYTIGIELERLGDQIIEGPQYDLLVRLLKWLDDGAGWVGRLFEHRDWMATNCAVFSNKQIDPIILTADLEEEDMTPEEVRAIVKEELKPLLEVNHWLALYLAEHRESCRNLAEQPLTTEEFKLLVEDNLPR